jgi:phage terminase Nu1 subunit (DNA packaging protein)
MSFKGKGIETTRGGLADYLGVALTTVDRMVKDGCPVVQRGGRGVEWTFNTADVRRWEIQKERALAAGNNDTADLDELKRRKLMAETGLIELELERKKKTIMPVWQMMRITEVRAVLIRVNMMNLPFRLEPQLIGETNPGKFKKVMTEEIRNVLVDAANAATSELEHLLSDEYTDAEFYKQIEDFCKEETNEA